MIIDDEQDIRAEVLPLEIMWRNPQPRVRARLRTNEKSNPYYGWAEQAKQFVPTTPIGTTITGDQHE